MQYRFTATKILASSKPFLRSLRSAPRPYILDKAYAFIQVLYNKDCISDQAIIYWHQKGSKPQGRQHFLKGTEPLVKVKQTIYIENDF
jgi:hypothetical protein